MEVERPAGEPSTSQPYDLEPIVRLENCKLVSQGAEAVREQLLRLSGSL